MVIDAAAEGDPTALASELEALGLEDPAVFGRMVSGRLPIPAIPALEDLASLRFARPAYAMTLVGSVTSQGDAAMRADIARSTFGVDGTGVTVGALSDSFNCLGGAAAGVASGDLPAGIVVLEESAPVPARPTKRGRMAEVIHDVAPGAAIAVHSAFNGQANFAQGIVDLANAGAQGDHRRCDLLRRADVPGRHHRPGGRPGEGAAGVAYFSAAGNQARKPTSPRSAPSGPSSTSASARRRRTTSIRVPALIPASRSRSPAGRRSIVDFQWDQPFFSVSGPPGSQSDLDIILTDAACNNIPLGQNPSRCDE